MTQKTYHYTCPIKCPIGKHCHILETMSPIKEPIDTIYKCQYQKKKIKIELGK